MGVFTDHLAATVVGCVVVLILLSLGAGVGDTENGVQIYEASRRQSQAFAQQLEGDLLNTGFGVPAADAIESWSASSIVIHRKADTTAAATPLRIEYRRVQDHTVAIDGVDTPIYEIQRYQDGVRSGGSPAALSSYSLVLLDASGAPTSMPANARAVRVQYQMSFGRQADDYSASASRYERTFYPPNLAD